METRKNINEVYSINSGYKCNLHCLYCHSPERSSRAFNQEKYLKIIRDKQIKAVSLEGNGEPTLNENFFQLIENLKDAGVEHIMLSTNGTTLGDRSFCEKLVNCIDYFVINLPACDAGTYKQATGTFLFDHVVSGLENLMNLGAGYKTRIFHIIYRDNYRLVPVFSKWLFDHYPDISFLNLIFMRNLGRANENKNLLPRYSDVVPFVKIALTYIKAAGKKAVIQNVPLCWLEGFESFSYEFMRWYRGNRVLETGIQGKLPDERCAPCTYYDACCGLRPDYNNVFNDGINQPASKSLKIITPDIL